MPGPWREQNLVALEGVGQRALGREGKPGVLPGSLAPDPLEIVSQLLDVVAELVVYTGGLAHSNIGAVVCVADFGFEVVDLLPE